MVVVLGTGTEIGKTWVACRLLEQWRSAGVTVAARKPGQSFDPDDGAPRDADLLAAASGESPTDVCPPHRSLPVPLAPPMAAARLGLPVPRLRELVAELNWTATPSGEPVDIGLVESAGGSRSPVAADGDGVDLARAVGAVRVVLVADAGLGTLHAVRSAVDGLGEQAAGSIVFLNRFDATVPLHRENADWLCDVDGLTVTTDLDVLARTLRSGDGGADPGLG